jgi:hypothetical protein
MEAHNSPDYEVQKLAKFNIMKERYDEVKRVLNNESYKPYLKALYL